MNKKTLSKIRMQEQMSKMATDLTEAFEEAEVLKKSKMRKQTLKDFLGEL